VGMKPVRYGLLGVLFLLLSFSAVAAEPEVTYEWLPEREGFRELIVTTPLANYLFSEDGGTLRSVLLTFAPYGSKVEELVYGTTTDATTFARRYTADAEFPFDLRGEGTEGTYALGEPEWTDLGGLVVTFTGELAGYSVVKRFSIEPDALYSMNVEVAVTPIVGVSGEEAAPELAMTVQKYIPQEKGRQLHYLFDGEPSLALLASGSYFSFGGLGLMDGDVVFFVIPEEGTEVAPFSEATESGSRRFGVKLDAREGTSSNRFTLYSGRRRFLLMEAVGIEALDKPGVGARAMVLVIQFLDILYRYTGNYGWAIILFTLMTRIILFPLMRKQYHSIAKTQKIQPRLKRIQERYKDDRQLMQQKTLEIYKKEGVNPMGGCLPMLIQLPIIFVIWRAMLYASEQIHISPGFLWIPDLSVYDPYFILVILTTLIMLVQQKFMSPMSTGDAKGIQKYMGYFFPLMMGVLLWRFPAGLWLYYLLTTAAQVGQQAFVNWEMAKADGGMVAVPVGEDDLDVETEDSDGDEGASAGG
jgi:YidC/Oxa1 family membrane protein insertase